MTKENLIIHAKSAAVTFVSVFTVEILVATNDAVYLADITWAPVVSATILTASRAALRLLITR